MELALRNAARGIGKFCRYGIHGGLEGLRAADLYPAVHQLPADTSFGEVLVDLALE